MGARKLSLAKRELDSVGGAGMVALLVVFEAFVARHWIDLTDPVSLSWRYSARAAETAVARLPGPLPGRQPGQARAGSFGDRADVRAKAVNLSAARARRS